MQRRFKDYTKARKKVCAALLEAGKTIGSVAKTHGLNRDLLALALTRYLKGEHILPRCPETYAALREMEEISQVVIMLGAQEGPADSLKAEVVNG